jgi:hypothetical protein
MVQITDDNGQQLGWAAAIIDLSSGSGPPPVHLHGHRVTGTRFLIGHTRDLADPAEPVVIREQDISQPPASGMSYADGTCPGCRAKAVLGTLDGDVMLILQHERHCRVLRKLLRQAGRL